MSFLRKPAVAGSLVVLFLAIAGWNLYSQYFAGAKKTAWPKVWYYDLTSEKLFELPSSTVPPTAAPGGPLPNGELAGVWSAVFACGSCDDKSKQFVAWVEKFTPETQKQLEDLIAPRLNGYKDFNPYETLNMWDNTGYLMGTPAKNIEWVQVFGPGAEKIKAEAAKKCKPQTLVRCQPS